MSEELLVVSGLRVEYDGFVAVDDVSLDVPLHSVVGLIGPNGAGKTSIVNALTGLARPTAGRVTFAGEDVTGLRAARVPRKGIARTFQSAELFADLTVDQNLVASGARMGPLSAVHDTLFPGRSRDRESIGWARSLCGLDAVASRKPGDLTLLERKLVVVARALAQRPRLLLLDEPAAGLDESESAELAARLRSFSKRGLSLLIVDHDLELVLGLSREVVVLDAGKVIARGSPDQVRSDPQVIRRYLGSSNLVLRAPGPTG